jgi:hypothetical protein
MQLGLSGSPGRFQPDNPSCMRSPGGEGSAGVGAGCQDPGMALALTGLRTVIYPSADLAADTAWWSQLLGTAPYFDQPFYVGFSVAGYELGLLPDADPADGALVYWGVDDVAAAVQEAIAGGSVEHTPVTASTWCSWIMLRAKPMRDAAR